MSQACLDSKSFHLFAFIKQQSGFDRTDLRSFCCAEPLFALGRCIMNHFMPKPFTLPMEELLFSDLP